MKITRLSILLLISILSFSIKAQTECNYFHRKNCGVEEGVSMKYDSQSKSAVMAKGQTSEFHLVAYKGLDYRISICADELLGTEVQLKIYEKERVLIKEEEYAEEEYQEEQNQDDEQSYSDDSYDEYSEESTYSDYDDSYDDSYSDVYSDDYSDDSYSEESNTETNQPKFKIVKQLLYDNADNAYANSIEFTADGTMSLVLEITIPGEAAMGKLKIREMGCVGVLIEHEKSKKTGF